MIKVPLSEQMIFEAEQVEKARAEKHGKGTVAYAKDRDLTGALAELAVEKWLNDNYITNHCTVREEMEGGDTYDAKIWKTYEEITFDVKGSKHSFNWNDRENNDIFIFKHHYAKIDQVNYLIFVRVWVKSKVAYILGAIEPQIFKDNSIFQNDQFHAKTGILKDLKTIAKED